MNIGGYGQGSVELLALRAKEQHQGGPPVPGGPTAANAGVTVHIYIYRKIKNPFPLAFWLSINAEWAICLAVEAGKLRIGRLLRTKTMSIEYNQDLLSKTLLEK